ncbi:MAG: acetyl-CoA decarbonylase/synthase complex subunit delta [Desulfobacterota bacterium]|nr:acetyl-CoA decarbonylase/synthase complex subunit delta [Thermodesulfobacteriota bacterium]
MAVDIPRQHYTGAIKEHIFGSGDFRITIGGQQALPFYMFEGAIPHPPIIAVQVLDYEPEDWPEGLKEPYRDVLHDPVAWARKAQDAYHADMVHLWLKSADPNGINRSCEQAAATAARVAEAVKVPLIVWGTLNEERDAQLLKAVAETCKRSDIIIGPVQEGNYKQLGALALAFGLRIVASSPIDINLAKQLNILLSNLGVPIEHIIIDPTTGGLGYGLEYTYSVMERIRQAALTQNDEKLQCPFLCNLADEVWKTKEVKLPSDALMGNAAERGIVMEAVTAATLLLAGADILVMRHPEAIAQVRSYIAALGGFDLPRFKTETAASQTVVQHTESTVSSRVASSLQAGALCKIVQIMDMPVDLAPGYAIALIKAIDPADATDGIVLGSHREHGAYDSEQGRTPADVPFGRETNVAPKQVAPPETVWEPISDATEAGERSREQKHDWRQIAATPQEQLIQIKTGFRYWYHEGYGSEKRKKPA